VFDGDENIGPPFLEGELCRKLGDGVRKAA
jgi:hypothetical protein